MSSQIYNVIFKALNPIHIFSKSQILLKKNNHQFLIDSFGTTDSSSIFNFLELAVVQNLVLVNFSQLQAFSAGMVLAHFVSFVLLGHLDKREKERAHKRQREHNSEKLS